MKIGNIIILPWDRRNFFPRLIVIGLFLAWVVWGLVLFQEGKEIDAKMQAYQQELARKEARARQAAAYEQSRIQNKLERGTSKNAVDSFKR